MDVPLGTVKLTPLLATPLTVTTTFPVVAPAGTGTVMLVALQLVGVAVVLLNLTVLVPWVAPKFVPVIVTAVPTGPFVGDRLVTLGGTRTVNVSALLASPPTVTTTVPVVAPAGTGTTTLVAAQLVGVAVVPLNVTVLAPWVAPTVTTTVPLVAPTGTGTTRLVADQLVGVAAVPLNVTVLVPCVAPKFVPVIVTAVPTGPFSGDRLAGVRGPVTVKF